MPIPAKFVIFASVGYWIFYYSMIFLAVFIYFKSRLGWGGFQDGFGLWVVAVLFKVADYF